MANIFAREDRDNMSSRDPLYGDSTHTDPFQAAQKHDSGNAQDKARNAADEAKAKGEQAMDMAQQKGQEAKDTAKQKADEVAGMAHERADQGIDKSAEGLDQAADALRQQGQQRGGTVGNVASTAADQLEGASSYLQGKDSSQMMDDLEDLIRRKPTESLLAAAGIGFVLSRVFR
jgi:ElaB/YqjD/DUF883 family membrane-anchored ribosome-binding protein